MLKLDKIKTSNKNEINQTPRLKTEQGLPNIYLNTKTPKSNPSFSSA